MDDHRRETTVSALDYKQGRRADAFAGYAFLVLSIGIGVITLIVDDLAVPAWVWAGLLIVWIITLIFMSYWSGYAGQLLFYGCALVTSWAMLATVSSPGSMIVVLLIMVAAIGSYLFPIRWVLGIVALNCLVSFAHMQITGADMRGSLAFTGFYLILHLATVFMGFAMLRETQLRAELEQKNLELEAAGVLLEDSAASSERLRISRELHDLIGHQLTVLNLELEAAKHREGAAAREHTERAGTLAKDLLADVRGTVGELRETTPGDLQQSLHRLASAVPSLDIHIEVDAGAPADEETSTTLVRAAQEIITNTIKHAEATELLLRVRMVEDTLILSGTNDGAAPRTITPGHGLTGLKERLELLGGSLEIRTTPQFTVEAQLPWYEMVKGDKKLWVGN